MNSIPIFRLAAALTAAAVLSACSCVDSGEAEKKDERIVVASDADFSTLVRLNFEEAEKMSLEPGKVYTDPEFAEIFELKDMTGDFNEEGLLLARVAGKTKPYSWWTRLWKGESEMTIAYRFIWFDKDGKMQKIKYNAAPRTRRFLPGEPVRFSMLAREEKCVKFSIAAGILKEEQDIRDAEQELKDVGTQMEREEPKKEEPLKEVKITQ